MRPLIRACQRFKTEIQAGSQLESREFRQDHNLNHGNRKEFQAGSQLESGELLIDKEVTGGNVRRREILYRFEDGSSAHRI